MSSNVKCHSLAISSSIHRCKGFGTKDIGLAITAFCSVCLLFFICDEGHNASFNVRTIFQKKILMVELGWMNSDAQVEINMFLRATEMNQANINLGGFFDVNRTLFKSVSIEQHAGSLNRTP